MTMRKISVVSLLVFGPYFGVEVQTQIVLLLLLICIVSETLASPYISAKLQKLELVALLVLWWTIWCGLILFQSKKNDVIAVILTVTIVFSNGVLMVVFLYQIGMHKIRERRLDKIQAKQKKDEGSFYNQPPPSPTRRIPNESNGDGTAAELVNTGEGEINESSLNTKRETILVDNPMMLLEQADNAKSAAADLGGENEKGNPLYQYSSVINMPEERTDNNEDAQTSALEMQSQEATGSIRGSDGQEGSEQQESGCYYDDEEGVAESISLGEQLLYDEDSGAWYRFDPVTQVSSWV